MLRFQPDVRVRYFSAPLDEALRAASLWSLLAGVDVEIVSVDDGPWRDPLSTARGWSLSISFAADADTPDRPFGLGDYLRRVLSPAFEIGSAGAIVTVEYAARRGALRSST